MKETDTFTMNRGASEEGFTMDVGTRKRNKQKTYDNENLQLNAKRKEKYKEKRDELSKRYSKVVVNDFCDDYHLSEEEKIAKNKYYQVFSKARRCKRKYRRLSDYVRTFRLCLDVLNLVAENNGLYSPEKFKMKVATGEIKIDYLSFPKYIGKDKRDINWDYVNKCIADRSMDPYELDKTTGSVGMDIDFNDEEALDEARRKMFGPQYLTIFGRRNDGDVEEDEEYIDEGDLACFAGNIFNDNYVEEPTNVTYEEMTVKTLSDKKLKKIENQFPELNKYKKDAKKVRDDNQRMTSFVFNSVQEDIEYLERLDRDKGYDSSSDVPKFKGDIMNNDDYNRYLFELRDWEADNIKANFRGYMKTLREINEIEFKEELERQGWNLRNMYKYKKQEKKDRKAEKREKKQEKKLKNKLKELENRRNRRNGKSDEVTINAKKKKKNKKKKNKKGGV